MQSHSTKASALRPWAQLHESILVLVMHRLPVLDHLCFRSMCVEWRDVHHRNRSVVPPAPQHQRAVLPYDKEMIFGPDTITLSPHPTDPDCQVAISDVLGVRLGRINKQWGRRAACLTSHGLYMPSGIVYCNGKFYAMTSRGGLVIIDPYDSFFFVGLIVK